MFKKKFFAVLSILAVMLTAAACATADGGDATGGGGLFDNFKNTWWLWAILLVFVAVVFIMPYFTRKKQREQVNTMMSGLKPGAKIKTIGGIVGEIVEIRAISPTEKHIVVRTGTEGSGTTLTFDINAIALIMKDEPAFDPTQPILPSDDEVKRLVDGVEREPVEAPIREDVARNGEAEKGTHEEVPAPAKEGTDDGQPPFEVK
ncbi:hypothetical protein FACS1894211_12360 [Clostridia bacterium]|nr:hypothetical protein FACS1894211_12360 [Clostridia bacterium]